MIYTLRTLSSLYMCKHTALIKILSYNYLQHSHRINSFVTLFVLFGTESRLEQVSMSFFIKCHSSARRWARGRQVWVVDGRRGRQRTWCQRSEVIHYTKGKRWQSEHRRAKASQNIQEKSESTPRNTAERSADRIEWNEDRGGMRNRMCRLPGVMRRKAMPTNYTQHSTHTSRQGRHKERTCHGPSVITSFKSLFIIALFYNTYFINFISYLVRIFSFCQYRYLCQMIL